MPAKAEKKKEIVVLCVDDFSTMRHIVKNLLRKIGYGRVMEADDGTMALDRLRSTHIDLVISDWDMPKMTGLDLLRFMRADKDLRHIPFLMIAAESEAEFVVAAKEAGVDGYIIKPFTAKTLREKVDAIFESRLAKRS